MTNPTDTPSGAASDLIVDRAVLATLAQIETRDRHRRNFVVALATAVFVIVLPLSAWLITEYTQIRIAEAVSDERRTNNSYFLARFDVFELSGKAAAIESQPGFSEADANELIELVRRVKDVHLVEKSPLTTQERDEIGQTFSAALASAGVSFGRADRNDLLLALREIAPDTFDGSPRLQQVAGIAIGQEILAEEGGLSFVDGTMMKLFEGAAERASRVGVPEIGIVYGSIIAALTDAPAARVCDIVRNIDGRNVDAGHVQSLVEQLVTGSFTQDRSSAKTQRIVDRSREALTTIRDCHPTMERIASEVA